MTMGIIIGLGVPMQCSYTESIKGEQESEQQLQQQSRQALNPGIELVDDLSDHHTNRPPNKMEVTSSDRSARTHLLAKQNPEIDDESEIDDKFVWLDGMAIQNDWVSKDYKEFVSAEGVNRSNDSH